MFSLALSIALTFAFKVGEIGLLFLQNPLNGAYSPRVQGLISTGTHMFLLSVLVAFYSDSQWSLLFFLLNF